MAKSKAKKPVLSLMSGQPTAEEVAKFYQTLTGRKATKEELKEIRETLEEKPAKPKAKAKRKRRPTGVDDCQTCSRDAPSGPCREAARSATDPPNDEWRSPEAAESTRHRPGRSGPRRPGCRPRPASGPVPHTGRSSRASHGHPAARLPRAEAAQRSGCRVLAILHVGSGERRECGTGRVTRLCTGLPKLASDRVFR